MTEWSKTWPTAPGDYWFYGRMYPSQTEDEMNLVKIVRAGQGKYVHLMCISGSHFIYESEATGVWKPARVPKAPSEPHGFTDKEIDAILEQWLEAYPETDKVVARVIFREGYDRAS